MANEFVSEPKRTWMQGRARNATEGLSSANSVSLTYTRQTSRVFTPTSGSRSQTTSAKTFTGHQIDLGSKQDDEGREDGDTAFIITYDRLHDATDGFGSSFEPTRRDRITVASVVYELLSWDQGGAKLRYTLMCKKVGT